MKQVYITILLLASITSANAQKAGTLDSSFGINGIIVSPSSILKEASGINITSTGKIRVCGVGGYISIYALVLFNKDGSFDNSFATNGIDTFPIPKHGVCGASCMTVQADGKVICGGDAQNDVTGQTDFTLVRYLPDGTLDTTLNGIGSVTTSYGNISGCDAIAIQPNGKIILTGGANNNFLTIRYNTDGSLDTTFYHIGIVSTPLGPYGGEAYAVMIQPTGKIIVAGFENNVSFKTIRYNINGSVDTTFADHGVLTTNFSGGSYPFCYAGVQQPDGKFILAGCVAFSTLGNNFAMARYNADGTVDSSFGVNGQVTTDINGDAIAYSIALHPDGKIVLGGRTRPGGSLFALAQYKANGIIDSAFGTNGTVTTKIIGRFDIIHSITTQPDGKIVVGGYAQDTTTFNYHMVIARYHGEDMEAVPTIPKSMSNFSLSPNPGTCIFSLSAQGYVQKATVTITDVQGKTIYTATHDFGSTATMTINLSHLANGIYYLKVSSPDGGGQVLKMVKE